MDRITLKVSEAAEMLGISKAANYEACRQNTIPNIRIGRRILVPKDALARMIASTGVESSDRPIVEPEA